MTPKPVPDRYRTVTPYLLVPRVEELISFLKRAFEAHELLIVRRPDGSINDAEVQIGDTVVMMGEPLASPLQLAEIKPMPASLYVYVPDCDTVYQQALQAGGTPIMEPRDMLHVSDRYCGVKDPSGNIWWIATHFEDLSATEQEKRFVEFARQLGPSFSQRIGFGMDRDEEPKL